MFLPTDAHAVVSSLPAAWLLQLARRERDRLSVAGRRLAPVFEAAIEDLARAAAEARSERRTDQRSESFRAPIVDGMSTRAAADRLGISTRAVVARCHRGTLRAVQRDDRTWAIDLAGVVAGEAA